MSGDSPRHPGRGGWAWVNARKRVLANATVCHLCGKELDFDAPPKSRWSPSVDHIVPVKALRGMDRVTQRRIALDPGNLRPAHFGCNASRGAGPIIKPTKPRRQSRTW